ncbi:MAG: hypothetical protein K2P58_10870 [Hyphomonadaceae bacterium]|nr:hypothetical protein [Hyphomonadaceae bacterium]
MAVALKTLLDKRKLALMRARFAAWWEGEAFDETAAAAEIEAQLVAANDRTEGADDALFDAPPFELPPRLAALSLLWGDDHVRPILETDAFDPAATGLTPDGVLALLGPGVVGPIKVIARAHPGRIEAFEWREETIDALRRGVATSKLDAKVSVTRIDLEAHVFTPNRFDAILSVDDFAYCSYPPHLVQQLMKSLKPGACALVESYTGLPTRALATAFASSFAEPHIRAHGDLRQFFIDVGFSIEADDDLTEPFLTAAKDGFKRLSERLADAGDLDVLTARELAWEVEAWRARMTLLTQRRLERRRFTLRKPGTMEAPDRPREAESPEEARARRVRDDNSAEVIARVLAENGQKRKQGAT